MDERINEIDLGEIARLIQEGYTSGRLEDETGKRIAWELKMEVWEEK